MTTKQIIRDLNAECPEGKHYGLVIMCDADNGDDADTQADSAFVDFYATEAEMDSAWGAARYVTEVYGKEAVIKRLDDLEHTEYVITSDTDDDGNQLPLAIQWFPKTDKPSTTA